MKSPFRLALCLVVLAAFPLAATAQGFGRPGYVGPGSIDKKDDRDRDDRSGIPSIRVYVPGATIPGVPTRSPFPDPRFPGQNRGPSPWDSPGVPGMGQHQPGGRVVVPGVPWDNSQVPGVQQPSSGINGRPAELPPVTPPSVQFTQPELKIPAHEFVSPKPPVSSTFHLPPSAVGRTGVGVFGLVGGGIAALFRALFGRRKEE
jgi:hypothetical protein